MNEHKDEDRQLQYIYVRTTTKRQTFLQLFLILQE